MSLVRVQGGSLRSVYERPVTGAGAPGRNSGFGREGGCCVCGVRGARQRGGPGLRRGDGEGRARRYST